MSPAAPSTPLTKSELLWWLGLTILTLAFGGYGNWRYEREHAPPPKQVERHSSDKGHEPAPEPDREQPAPDPCSVFSSALYHAVQFLSVHGTHLHEPIPWELHWGRWLGVAWASLTGFLAYWHFFRQTFLPPSAGESEHVVICGLGDLGMRLAADARKQHKSVIAIEKKKTPEIAKFAKEHEIKVIVGDATKPETWSDAKLHQCESLLVACADDATNDKIATLVGQDLIQKGSRPNSPLICRLLVRDPQLRDQMATRPVSAWGPSAEGASPDYRVHFRDLDLHDAAARQASRKFPFDFQPIREKDSTRVHVVVVGYGPMGKAMVAQAARIGHYANETVHKIRITVVEATATADVAAFKNRHLEDSNEKPGSLISRIDRICELNGLDLEQSSSSFIADLKAFLDSSAPGELQTVVLCVDLDKRVEEFVAPADDYRNEQLHKELKNFTNDWRQLLTFQSTRTGNSVPLPGSTDESSRRVHSFGMIEDLQSWNVLLHESEDQIARAIHADYALRYNYKPWDQIPEDEKESNRHAGDHAPVKFRALGYHDALLDTDVPRITFFSEDQKLLMAKMEHRRWCAERFLNGWKWGEKKDKPNKIHPLLVAWDDLPFKEKRKDYEQIENLPKVYSAIGRGIYR